MKTCHMIGVCRLGVRYRTVALCVQFVVGLGVPWLGSFTMVGACYDVRESFPDVVGGRT